ncbi:DNA mismatch repair endonuclease MutL [Candidatus Coxiella mudrowiae]|uniref:DNA mismatch repair endonuclease MutL n=1 Tax=Candidatus Coxiella mudrowiae TaxID=2054173 RepID=UPI000C28FA62|nr:DNA mismatch repair endonuclease MutL [Candidatus Coxiella mudrowiae]
MRIHRLSDQTANQISAGEVIERPASVVKELIENSIDAEATQIRIDILQGGLKQIRVQDNGKGIHYKDLPLALERYATSKIKNVEDLERVITLGFRGEALASITAVARLQLTSRQCEANFAYFISNLEENLTSPMPAAHPQGTTVEIQDLFYNIPARRKFLRTPTTEFQHIERVIDRIALCHFSIGFTLHHNGKEIMNFRAALTTSDRMSRIKSILGDAFLESALSIEFIQSGLSLRGYIAEPHYTRSQPDLQFIYIDGRFVRDKLIAHAVRQAYHDVLFHGRHPAYILYLTVDPSLVDVNVHPTKQEVRFRDRHWVRDFIIHAVSEALVQIRPGLCETSIQSPVKKVNIQNNLQIAHVPHLPLSLKEDIILYKKKKITSNRELVGPPFDYPLGHALAQLHEIYILAQNKKGLVIVDIHAAHERILYEKMKQEKEKGEIVTQSLVVPLHVTLNPQEIAIYQANQYLFLELEFEIGLLDSDKIIVRRHPSLIKAADIEKLIRDVLADLIVHAATFRMEEKINATLASLACHAAIHAPYRLTLEKMEALLRDMEKTMHGGLCNHGRPTWKQFEIKELDRLFLRGQ